VTKWLRRHLLLTIFDLYPLLERDSDVREVHVESGQEESAGLSPAPHVEVRELHLRFGFGHVVEIKNEIRAQLIGNVLLSFLSAVLVSFSLPVFCLPTT